YDLRHTRAAGTEGLRHLVVFGATSSSGRKGAASLPSEGAGYRRGGGGETRRGSVGGGNDHPDTERGRAVIGPWYVALARPVVPAHWRDDVTDDLTDEARQIGRAHVCTP